jgi:hypothetical protein
MTATLRWAFVLALSLLPIGCEFKGEAASSPEAAADDGPKTAAGADQIWRARPEAIRIYPATQFTTSDGAPTLKASIELLDAMNDAIKAPGRLRCELFAVNERGQVGGRLYHWDVPLYTLQQQRQYFDLVTRTYTLRLELDNEQVTQRPTMLRVAFMPPEGPRLQDQRTLPIEW